MALVLSFSPAGFVFAVSSPPPSPGDIIINEFVSDGDEWVELLNTSDNDVNLGDLDFKLTELTTPQAPQGDILFPTEIVALELTGIIPAHGILVFEVSGLNDPGDSIALYKGIIDLSNLWQRVTYGAVNENYPVTAGLEIAPAAGQSGAFTSWSVDDSPSKGWFNDAGEPGKAPLLSTIDQALTDAGIDSNIGELENPSATPPIGEGGDGDALYFEKTGEGKIVFTASLNLTDEDTVAILQVLGEKMDMSEGHIEFDSATARAMTDTGAKIYMFGLDFASTPNIIVRDDDGDAILLGSPEYPDLTDIDYNAMTGTLTFSASHFTQFDADDDVYVDVNNDNKGADGTEENPFNTIQEGIDAVPEGGTVNVAAGNYEENLTVDKNLTLVGTDGAALTTIDGTNGNNDDDEVVLLIEEEITDLEVSGFTFTGGETGIYASDSFTDATINIHDVIVTGNDNYGIYFSGASGSTLTFTNVTVTNNGNDGIYLSGDSGSLSNTTVTITGGEIANNDGNGIYVNSLLNGSTFTVEGTTIGGGSSDDDNEGNSGNGIYVNDAEDSAINIQNNNNTISWNEGHGVYLCAEGECYDTDITITDNEITNNEGWGVNFYYIGVDDDSSTVEISGNTIDNNNNGGIVIEQTGNENEENEDAPEITIDNNEIKDNDGPGISLGSPVTGVAITNNTITGNGSGDTTGIVVNSAAGNYAHNNKIFSNVGHGVDRDDDESNFDAEQNWWGCVAGPGDPDDQDCDSVSENVIFSPWYANEAMTILGNTTTDDENDNQTVTLPSAILMTGDVMGIEIPAGIVVTGPSGWDGTINLPVVTTTTVPPVPDSGNDASVVGSIEIGFGNTLLTFNKGVRLSFANQAGNSIGYSHGAGTFTAITNICGADSQETGDALPAGGDCKMDVGSDLVVWTKHFSTFTTYTQSAIPSSPPPPPPPGGERRSGGQFRGREPRHRWRSAGRHAGPSPGSGNRSRRRGGD